MNPYFPQDKKEALIFSSIKHDNKEEVDSDYKKLKTRSKHIISVSNTEDMYKVFINSGKSSQWYEIDNNVLIELTDSLRSRPYCRFASENDDKECAGCKLSFYSIRNIIVRNSQRRRGLAKSTILQLIKLASPRHVVVQMVSSPKMKKLVESIPGMVYFGGSYTICIS